MKFGSEVELRAAVGTHLGYSRWMTIDQERVNNFADTTLDHQWIHIDVERAKKESPFGATIGHGLLGLSLIPHLTEELLEVENIDLGINYGFNKVRFTSPMFVGARVRAGATLVDVAESRAGSTVTLEVVLEADGSERPLLVAEWLMVLAFSEET